MVQERGFFAWLGNGRKIASVAGTKTTEISWLEVGCKSMILNGKIVAQRQLATFKLRY